MKCRIKFGFNDLKHSKIDILTVYEFLNVESLIFGIKF